MLEDALATQAVLHILILPGAGKQRALRLEIVDEAGDLAVAEGVAEVGAELGEQAAGAVFPVRNQRAGALRQKNKAQQIALVPAVEPAAKQVLGRLIPAARGPEPVEPVGRARDHT